MERRAETTARVAKAFVPLLTEGATPEKIIEAFAGQEFPIDAVTKYLNFLIDFDTAVVDGDGSYRYTPEGVNRIRASAVMQLD